MGVVKQYGLETDGKIALYLPLQQDPDRGMFLVVRSSLEDAGLSAAIVREIHAVDPTVVVYGFRTMQDRLYDSLARQRFSPQVFRDRRMQRPLLARLKYCAPYSRTRLLPPRRRLPRLWSRGWSPMLPSINSPEVKARRLTFISTLLQWLRSLSIDISVHSIFLWATGKYLDAPV